MTWERDGTHHVTIAVGWGENYGLMQRATDHVDPGRVFTFRVGGEAEMPTLELSDRTELTADLD